MNVSSMSGIVLLPSFISAQDRVKWKKKLVFYFTAKNTHGTVGNKPH